MSKRKAEDAGMQAPTYLKEPEDRPQNPAFWKACKFLEANSPLSKQPNFFCLDGLENRTVTGLIERGFAKNQIYVAESDRYVHVKMRRFNQMMIAVCPETVFEFFTRTKTIFNAILLDYFCTWPTAEPDLKLLFKDNGRRLADDNWIGLVLSTRGQRQYDEEKTKHAVPDPPQLQIVRNVCNIANRAGFRVEVRPPNYFRPKSLMWFFEFRLTRGTLTSIWPTHSDGYSPASIKKY
jgi:hypothetical protein